jgi:hypothetical protein
MGVTTTQTNKPFNPRGNDQSPKGFNRAKLYSGKALSFDGVNDYVDCGSIEVQSFSLITNVYFDLLSNTDTLAGNWDSSNGFMLYKNSSNNMFVYINSAKVQTDISEYVGHWTQFVATYDGTTAKLYANGVLINSEAYAATINYSSGSTFKVGAYGNTPGGLLNGDVAGTKIFNTALTAAQIADLYNNPEKIVPTGVDNTALKLWLPMQEGAGTTAYDGSGNGNHGTISGATYVNGVGAPVSQTAVIDWNKGTNETAYSEEFNSWSTKNDITITDNDATAPDGQETAATITFAASEANARVQNFKAGAFESKTQIVSVWARVTSGTAPFRFKCSHGGVTDYFSNDLTATTEWQRFSFSQTFGSSAGTGVFYGLYNGTDLASRSLEFWGFQLQTDAAALTPYVRTGATAQTTPVLLPQGLTSGRDITGVNLFENVRKQGALNLDGNSYAEVHDNASLDVTTGVSIEAWVDWVSPSASKGILAKWGSSSALYAWLFQARSNSAIRLYIYDGTNYLVESSTLTEGWRHLCATYDGVTLRMYIDGQADTTTAHTGSIPSVQEPVKIGAYGAITSTTYEHDIAQPRIYNRALTAEEVQRNYNAGKNIYTN